MARQQSQQSQRQSRGIFSYLGWPLMGGMAAWVGFYALLHNGTIQHPLLLRYLAGHPVEYLETALFAIGMAALVLAVLATRREKRLLRGVTLSPIPAGGQPADQCHDLMRELDQLPAAAGRSRLAQRLRGALEYIRRRDSADGLDDELRYLSEADADRQHEQYALVRLIIWAIPILGFLGTVIGITMALSNLSGDELKESMETLKSALGVAFDTTALALSLSMVLMFVQFLCDRFDHELMTAIDEESAELLTGRFQQLGTSSDPNVASIRRMSEAVIHTTEDLVRRQAELWQSTIDAAHMQWRSLVDTAGATLQQSLSGALDQSIRAHATHLVSAEQTREQRVRDELAQLHSALRQNAETMKSQQAELVVQGELMVQAIEAAGKVQSLEKALNDNLNALAGAHHFEDTVMSLSAAIHLLNARLGHGHAGPPQDPSDSKSKGRAA